ncbi:putative reverse transcriptase domain-containing protein, partial [Tanacetum coccineum]
KVSTDRPIVSTDGSKVSTDRQIEGTEDQVEGAEDQVKGTDEHNEGTEDKNEGTEEIFEGTEELREGTEEKVESTDGQVKGTEDQTEEEIATQTSTQTPTSMIFGDDETIAKVLLNMSKAKAVSKEKEKGVELKDVEETDRPRPTSTRSLLTLKPLPKIDPKDKGKKKIEEEDESESESDGIPQAEKKFKQLESDEELARKVQEEWEAEEERNRIAEEKAANEELIRDFDDMKARIEADRLLAEKLQEQEREQFTIEERAKFLHDTIAAQRKFLAQQRSEAIRNKPPTKNQLRNQMMTYLKHVGNYKHAELKIKKFEEVQALYEKIKRSDEDFISIGSAEDERLIKRMNEKGVGLSKSEVIKEESKEEVQEEVKDEESTRKRKIGTRKKMKSRKRRYIQNTSEDDSDKENDELRLYLTIAQDEEKEVDYEILDRKYPIKEWKTECLGAKPQTDQAEHLEEINLNVVIRSNGQKRYFSTLMTVLSIFDREDLNAVYQLVMDKYQDEMPEGFDRVLWGDLMVLFNPDDKDEFWSSQLDWIIVSWKLHSSSGVHTLVTDTGLVIHMLVEKKYPLRKEVLMQMLKLKLESEEENTMALELIKFVKKILGELESEEHKNWLVHKQTACGKDFSNPFMVDNLPKIVGLSTHLASVVKSWLVHDQTVHEKRLFETPGLEESSSPEFDLFSDIEEHSEEEETTKIMMETMEQYMSKTRGNYRSGVARPKINDKTYFELKEQFLKELRENTFSGSKHEDANEHIEKVLKIVDLFHIPEVTQDQIMLRAFPMSLTGAASRWLRNEPSGLTEPNRRDHVKSISTAKADSSVIRHIRLGPYAVSDTHYSSLSSAIVLFPNQLHGYFCDDWKEAREVKILETYDHTLPQKEKDPWSFTLPCLIYNVCFDKAIVDLGASVSVMPFSTYSNLGLDNLLHTRLTIELANKTLKHPRGIAKNVLVRIGKFIFLIDFVILDIPEDDDVPLILGQPFLSTAHAKIDVFKRKFTLKVGEEKLVFKRIKPATSIIRRVYLDKEEQILVLKPSLYERLLMNHSTYPMDKGDHEGKS